MRTHTTDVLVIGSGIAGLSFALDMADHARVAVVTKKGRAASSTNYARGGIAAVVAEDDAPELHIRDTLLAGAGLCHADAVSALVREGPARVRELTARGVQFSRAEGSFSLGREGGHSRRRIVHAADLTGREIERALLAAVAAHESIELFEDHLAVDLLTGRDAGGRVVCGGSRVLDHGRGELEDYRARVTLLATGGFGRAFRHTTNPDIATGDGIAMAYRAGAEVMNLEFVQFHPTALYPAEDRAILISEAVRGEGAVLRRRDGTALLARHPMGSLATRDVVARAIDLALKESGDEFVLLDLSAIDSREIETRFPGIFEECMERGLDIRTEPIPVVPAAHYVCGGVRTDLHGRTTLGGLYAVGEAACTGVHGANRLASNSLLEAVVFSHRAAAAAKVDASSDGADAACAPVDRVRSTTGAADRSSALEELRTLMWDHVGIVRSDERLEAAESRLRELRAAVERASAEGVDADLVELRNLVEVSLLTTRSARARRESRGLHFTTDHPFTDNERFLRDTVLKREAPAGEAA